MFRQVELACPRCGIALVAAPTEPIPRHDCRDCGGVWIDEAELRRVLEELRIDPQAPIGPLTLEAGPLRCPRCGKPMAVERTRGEEPTAQIDVCPDHGAWFDRGELAHVLERLGLAQIEEERGPYHGAPIELVPFIWLYRLFRRDPAEPPRTRGRPS